MSLKGQSQTLGAISRMSGLPLIADIGQTCRKIRESANSRRENANNIHVEKAGCPRSYRQALCVVQVVKERFRLSQISRVETFVEPTINRM